MVVSQCSKTDRVRPYYKRYLLIISPRPRGLEPFLNEKNVSVCWFSQFQTQFRISNPLALNSVVTNDPKSAPDPHHAKSCLRVSRAAKLTGFDH